jgi:CYTH domain-containing protein/thymidylate kinase
MSHQTTTIVLTGGPCAGKSSSLSYVAEHLKKHGYYVVIINELATELQHKGLVPGKTIASVAFQEQLLQEALLREAEHHASFRETPQRKNILLCDRGIADSRAYLTTQEWEEVLKKAKLTMSSVFSRYDLVLHLQSVAIDKPELYTTHNNSSRRESVTEAVEVDRKTLCAWLGHESLRVIDNQGSFDDKKSSILNEILHFLGHPTPLEIEAKYLVSPSFSPAWIPVPYAEVTITQHYLDTTTRIRERKLYDGVSYTHTIKTPTTTPSVRIEVEKHITEEEFVELLEKRKSDSRTIKKKRYYFVYKNKYFELDVFEGIPLVLLELEASSLSSLKSVELPPWIPIEKEVSTDWNYYNSTLAKRPL